MMFNIKDPTLTKLLLEHLVEQAEAGGLDQLLASGLSPDLVDDLRKRPIRDIFYATRQGELIAVQIDVTSLRSCLWRRDAARHTETIKEYFILHGASIELLRAMFTLSKLDLQQLRGELGSVRAASNGRPRMPPSVIRDKIHQRWHSIVRSQPNVHAREHLWLLHQEFSAFTISALYQVVNEFDVPGKKAHAAPQPDSKQTSRPTSSTPTA